MIRGDTTLYGRCLGTELRSRSAKLRLPGGAEISATVRHFRDFAQLSERTGEIVGLEGSALWDFDRDMALVEFTVTAVNDYRESGDLIAAFEKLRELAGGAWDGVDVEAYIREIRGEDEDAGP